MKRYQVLLYDEEAAFVQALMNYVNRNAKIPILIFAFTNIADVKEYIREHEVDLLIMPDVMLGEAICNHLSTPVLWMVEEWISGELEEDNKIIRYSSASEYVKKMLLLLSNQNKLFQEGRDCVSIAVYSPIGGKEVSRFAQLLSSAQLQTEQNPYKTGIYLPWEEFCEEIDPHCRMEELLYHVKQHTGNISMKMKTLSCSTQGYDTIPNAVDYQELRELTMEDLHWLFQTLKKEGYYHFLIADIGPGSLPTLELLTEFDVIYLPYVRVTDSGKRLECFLQNMQQQQYWNTFSERCFPVAVTMQSLTHERIRLLETKRKAGTVVPLRKGGEGIGGTDL